MSYEVYRNALVTRIADKLPTKLLNDIMQEIDLLSQDYSFEKNCTDLITFNGTPEIVKAYIAALAIQNCAKSTLENYTRQLILFFEKVGKSFMTITANDIRCYLFDGETTKGWKPSTKEHMRIVLNSFFNWLVDNEYLNRSPMRTIKPFRLPKQKLPPLKQIELEEFRNACQTDRERALVDFLFATGCRISEVKDALIEDVDWRERSVVVRHGKGDKRRVTYFNAEAELSLRRYLESRKGNDPHLFVKSKAPYNGLTKEMLEREIKKIGERIPGLSIKVTPHTFRRTMGTTAATHCCPIEKVKQLLGHENINTTMQYVTVSQEECKQAHEKYLAG